MKKYITKEQLADFIVKMWDAKIRVETHPADNYLSLWSNALNKHIYVDVAYESMAEDIINELKEE